MSWCAIKSHFINYEKNLKSLKLLMKNLKLFFFFLVFRGEYLDYKDIEQIRAALSGQIDTNDKLWRQNVHAHLKKAYMFRT